MATLGGIANVVFRQEYQDAGFTAGMEAAAAASRKAAAAGEAARESVSKTTQEVTRAGPAWGTVNKALDENAKLAAATERADRKLEQALAAIRAEAAKNADVAGRQAELEKRANAQRDETVRKAREAAAAERARWEAVGAGTTTAGRGMASLGSIAGSAGQQLQDVVIQAQMGTSAFTILAQQGSQFLGIFGPGGAAAGAALAIGAVALGALGLVGNMKTLDDVTKETGATFDRLKGEAEARAKGFKEEAEAVHSLASAYGAMGEAGRRAEGIVTQRQTVALNQQANALTGQLGGGLANRLSAAEAQTFNPESVLGSAFSATVARLPADLAAGTEAFRKLRDETGLTVDGLRAYITALDDASRAGGGNYAELVRLRDGAADALPKVAELEEAQRRTAVQAAAMRLALGETEQQLIAAGEKAGSAGGKFNALSGEVIRAAVAMERLRQVIADDPLRDIAAQASRTADMMAALRAGGTAAYDRVKDAQEAAADAQTKLNKVTEDYVKARAPVIGQLRAEEEAHGRRGGWLLEIQREAQAVRDLAREHERVKQAEQDATSAAKRAASAGASAARKAERAEERDAATLQSGFDKWWDGAEKRAEDRAGKAADKTEDVISEAYKKAETERAQAAKSATDNVMRYVGDAFAELFRDTGDGWAGMWKRFADLARATLARIAAEALIRPIIQPVVASFMGQGGGGLGSFASFFGPGRAGAAGGAGTGSGGGGVLGGGMDAAKDAYTLYDAYSKLGGGGLFGSGSSGGGGPLFSVSTGSNASYMPMSTQGLSDAGALSRAMPAGPTVETSGVYTPATMGNSLSYGLGQTAYTGVGGANVSYAGAIGGAAGVVGGGLAMYQGIQRGGSGGYTSAAGGAVAAASGLAMMGALGPSLAALGPYGAIAAAVIMLIGSMLPGEKPSNKTGSASLQLDTGQMDVFGLGGKRFSQENRDAATKMANDFGKVANQLGTLIGAAPRGQVTVDVGNRDGLGYRMRAGAGYDTGTLNFGRDEAGDAELRRTAVSSIIDVMVGTGGIGTTLVNAMVKPLIQMSRESAEVMLTNVAKLAEATGGGKMSDAQQAAADRIDFADDFDTGIAELKWVKDVYDKLTDAAAPASAFGQQMAALNAQWTETIQHAERLGLATGALTDAWARASEELLAQRATAVRNAVVGLQGRLNAATGGDTVEAQLYGFDMQAANEMAAWKRQLHEWNLAVEQQLEQIGLMERVHGAERAKIIADYHDRIAEAEKQALDTRAATAAGWVRSLATYASGLRTRGDSPLSATQQYWGASSGFQTTLSEAMAGSGDAIQRLSGSADTFLGASRAIYGSGEGYARDWQRVVDALGQMAAKSPDELTASVLQAEVRTQTQVLAEELQRLRAEVTALRTEQRLANAVPAAA